MEVLLSLLASVVQILHTAWDALGRPGFRRRVDAARQGIVLMRRQALPHGSELIGQEYRSVEAEPGYFRRVGSVHVHVDGGATEDMVPLLRQLVRELEDRKYPGKVNRITRAIEGPQRRDPAYVQTYDSHTPGDRRNERFDVFSTTSFGEKTQVDADVIDGVRHILAQLRGQPGTIIEVERVAATISAEGHWHEARPALIATIDDSRVGVTRSGSAPVEIHHAFDVSKNGSETAPPLSIEQVLQISEQLGLRPGGWFLFEKSDAWSYRSSQFTTYDDYKEVAQEQHAQLARCLREELGRDGGQIRMWTLVEQVLGIWNIRQAHTPGSVSRASVPELARWESACGAGCQFWVIAANFLGDRDPDVRQAMLDNLRQNVRYTYFLHSFADVQRLRQLVKSLEDELKDDVTGNVRAVLLWNGEDAQPRSTHPHPHSAGDSPFGADYFIAQPGPSNKPEGYRLKRDVRGDVISGERLNSQKLRSLIGSLNPLLGGTLQGVALPVLARQEVAAAVLFTDLEGSLAMLQKTAPDDWERVLTTYDCVVATEASKAGGVVVRAMNDGYLLRFNDVGTAAECAKRLQRRVDEHNSEMQVRMPRLCIPKQRVALGYGSVWRVERSHGYDLGGALISLGARIVGVAEGGHIIMTARFRDAIRESVGAEHLDKTTVDLGDVRISGVDDAIELYELLWSDNNGHQVVPMDREQLGKRAMLDLPTLDGRKPE